MRALVLSLFALMVSSNALAGGIGLLVNGGFHSQPVYFYDSSRENLQVRQQQTILMGGTGLELVLGDRDDRFVGLFRGYWTAEAPERDPAEITTTVDPQYVVANWREDVKHYGIGAVGVQWGYWGKPENFQLTALATVGSGFLSPEHEEYLMIEVGGGAAYRLSRSLQLAGNAAYQLRHRKGYMHGAQVYVSLRYLID